MSDLEDIVSIYQRIFGLSDGGDRNVDRVLWQRWGYADEPVVPHFTGSMDDACGFLKTVLPSWQIHEIHHGVERVHCEICETGDAENNASGQGRSIALAILSATFTAMLTQNMETAK